MKPAAWRVVILVLCGITGLAALAELFGATGLGGASPWLGIWGATVSASSQPFDLTIQSIDPGGAAELGGLRAGDRVDLRANDLLDRFSLLGQPLSGRPRDHPGPSRFGATNGRRDAGSAQLEAALGCLLQLAWSDMDRAACGADRVAPIARSRDAAPVFGAGLLRAVAGYRAVCVCRAVDVGLCRLSASAPCFSGPWR